MPFMANLEVNYLNWPERPLISGEIYELRISMKNIGLFPLSHLKMALSHPTFFLTDSNEDKLNDDNSDYRPIQSSLMLSCRPPFRPLSLAGTIEDTQAIPYTSPSQNPTISKSAFYPPPFGVIQAHRISSPRAKIIEDSGEQAR